MIPDGIEIMRAKGAELSRGEIAPANTPSGSDSAKEKSIDLSSSQLVKRTVRQALKMVSICNPAEAIQWVWSISVG